MIIWDHTIIRATRVRCKTFHEKVKMKIEQMGCLPVFLSNVTNVMEGCIGEQGGMVLHWLGITTLLI